MQSVFHVTDLEQLFARLFSERWETRLEGGAEEPFYVPSRHGCPATIRYTRDYFRSALHEVAHWCIAGARRRALPDFGYWYQPDGRDGDTQAAFQRVEEKPQALELIFCAACGHPFSVSLDNLSGESTPAAPFENAVWTRAAAWLGQGSLPERAAVWAEALRDHYRPGQSLDGTSLEAVFSPLPHD